MFNMRFGIPSIDELFGGSPEGEAGIHLPQRRSALPASGDPSPSSVSLCITGPGGTGKSILGMHLASHYLADCRNGGDPAAKVLYISTDLKHEVAQSMWARFGLDRPNHRVVPFMHGPSLPAGVDPFLLKPCHPLQSPEGESGVAPLSQYLIPGEPQEPHVYFVDLASNTAGDDWGFVSRVLSVVERADRFPHLMIIDSVEGFETLVGERDAFGESQPRRSRVAQILRAAGDKWHIVFIIEEPREGEHPAEEFVTDVVIRLRSVVFRDYSRRTIEIVKARGQAHVRGQHILLIRSGAGSTTGKWLNPDDPEVLGPGESRQSYVHACPSLHHLNRRIMSLTGQARPQNKPEMYAAFGIRYLDDMLEVETDDFRRDHKGNDQRGLRCRTATALIGNSQTQKSPLGYAFLSRCFRSYAERLAIELAHQPGRSSAQPREGESRASGAEEPAEDAWESRILRRFRELSLGERVTAAALRLGPPREESDGIPVLLTTLDFHTEKLTAEFLPWLRRKVPALGKLKDGEEALEVLMQERTICRRLEIHDMPSAVLIHIVQRAIEAAQSLLFRGKLPASPEERYKRSAGIRVVIDDLSILRDTYAEVRDDPLLLRCLLFLLEREGVTTLLIDTQEGHPHLTIPSPSDSELRSLVTGHIYTWRFPFYDGNRVAIAAVPSLTKHTSTVIRELRPGTGEGTGPECAPLVVDPHFELYSGIETGRPKPIPLKILLYEETPAFKRYIAEENRRCSDLFTPSEDAEGGRIILGYPASEYQQLWERASTQRDVLLDHVLLLQVDEFWSLKRPTLRRSGAARSVWDYLHAKTSVDSHGRPERIWAVDPFAWFQRSLLDQESQAQGTTEPPAQATGDAGKAEENACRRADAFVVHGYSLKARPDEFIDRVPFMWDFGFLLCRLRAWEDEHSAKRKLTFLSQNGNPEAERYETVAQVWSGMPRAIKKREPEAERPSWRVFLEACYQLASAHTYSTSIPTQAFDLHVAALPGLSCLILEIWVSEIFDTLDEVGRHELLALVSRREWSAAETGLIELLARYQRELFRTWLLLVEVLDLQDLATAISEGRLADREAKPASIAVRHWYKTAWARTQSMSVDDPLVPAGLPGHFSVRGDWFLAVAGGSRSERLADQALDFFNTRSANYKRLSCGLGLPVRRVVTDHLRTGILTLDQGEDSQKGRRVSSVHYENLIRLGGPVEGLTSTTDPALREPFHPTDFHWFWRSRLAQFARHTRVWHDWLRQTIVWWNRMRQLEADDWMNGFVRYDQMLYGCGTPPKAWEVFEEHCAHLIRELKDASLPA